MAAKKTNPTDILLVACALSIPCAWFGNFMGQVLGSAANPLEVLFSSPLLALRAMAASPLSVSLAPAPLIGTLLGIAVPWCAAMGLLVHMQGNARPGEEHGSARFADPRELAPFRDFKNPDPKGNALLLSKNVGLALSRTGFTMDYDRNLNVLVIGGSGAGKTRYYVKPNVLQLNTDLFITDPKGSLVKDVGQLLVDEGYEIRSFNTFKPEKSMRYNPLHYVRTDLEIQSFAKLLIQMTTGTKASTGDPFWEKAETQLYIALIAFMRDYLPEDEYHMGTLIRLLGMAEVKEENENYKSPLDMVFEELSTGYRMAKMRNPPARRRAEAAGTEEPVTMGDPKNAVERRPSPFKRNSDGRRPYLNRHEDGSRGFKKEEDYALENYLKFKTAAGKTLKSIIISCNVRLAPFTAAEVKSITCGTDEMHLERFGDADKKNAIFAIFEDVDQRTLGFLHGIMVYQAIKILCAKAETMPHDRLPRCVNFLLDEYRSLNLPADISAAISVIRSRNIAMSIILQGISQLGELYDEQAAKSIRACCDTVLFLGSQEEDTRKFISDLCGQMTVDDVNYSSSHGQSGSWSKSNSKIARPLISSDEVARLPGTKCIVSIRGAFPAIDDKYPLERHERYGAIADACFDVNEYWERKGAEEAAETQSGPAERAPSPERPGPEFP